MNCPANVAPRDTCGTARYVWHRVIRVAPRDTWRFIWRLIFRVPIHDYS